MNSHWLSFSTLTTNNIQPRLSHPLKFRKWCTSVLFWRCQVNDSSELIVTNLLLYYRVIHLYCRTIDPTTSPTLLPSGPIGLIPWTWKPTRKPTRRPSRRPTHRPISTTTIFSKSSKSKSSKTTTKSSKSKSSKSKTAKVFAKSSKSHYNLFSKSEHKYEKTINDLDNYLNSLSVGMRDGDSSSSGSGSIILGVTSWSVVASISYVVYWYWEDMFIRCNRLRACLCTKISPFLFCCWGAVDGFSCLFPLPCPVLRTVLYWDFDWMDLMFILLRDFPLESETIFSIN